MNIDPQFWGEQMWVALYAISLTYPTDNPSNLKIMSAKRVFESLQYLLPCDSCQTHYQKFIKIHPISNHLDSSDTLTKWLNKIHNEINKILNKNNVSINQMKSLLGLIPPIPPTQTKKNLKRTTLRLTQLKSIKSPQYNRKKHFSHFSHFSHTPILHSTSTRHSQALYKQQFYTNSSRKVNRKKCNCGRKN